MKMKMKMTRMSLIECGQTMNSYTFSMTVRDLVEGQDPLTLEGMMDYITLVLESQSVVQVTNLVRDY